MKFFKKISFLFLLTRIFQNYFLKEEIDIKTWFKRALLYGFAMDTKDYKKYISEDYTILIDGKIFNFQQWLRHIKNLKKMMKEYQVNFNEIIVEGNNIAANYNLLAVKKDDTTAEIKIIATFKIADGKIISSEENTCLLQGSAKDKTFATHD